MCAPRLPCDTELPSPVPFPSQAGLCFMPLGECWETRFYFEVLKRDVSVGFLSPGAARCWKVPAEVHQSGEWEAHLKARSHQAMFNQSTNQPISQSLVRALVRGFLSVPLDKATSNCRKPRSKTNTAAKRHLCNHRTMILTSGILGQGFSKHFTESRLLLS